MPWMIALAIAAGAGALFYVHTKSAASMPLDSTLSAAQKAAVTTAIIKEPNASTLADFSLTLIAGGFPLAGAAVRARAVEIQKAGMK